jgi:hypothetical protein
MAVIKSQAVSIRVEPRIKEALQSAAALEMRSLANMVEVMVVAYCRAQGYPLDGVSSDTLQNTDMRGNADHD